MALTIGSICSGYGGLDMALEDFYGAKTAWFAEFDPAPSKVLAHHWPTVPNLGDIAAVDWASVPDVDIIAGGTPCQDLSAAGRRKGMTEGTRSNLWVQMREAIAVIRPSLVVWENVRGAFSAYAHSEVESEEGLFGESYGPDRPALRAIERVLLDLASLGYDAEWVSVRASDAGAPHRRFRVFVLAHANGGGGRRWPARSGAAEGDNATVRSGSRDAPAYATSARFGSGKDAGASSCNASARARGGEPERDSVPNAAGLGWGEGWPESARIEGRFDNEFGSASTLADTVRVGFGEHAGESSAEEAGSHSGNELADHRGVRPATEWGPYRPAIERWERVLGRFAPAPTERSARGSQRLSPRFVEWMMGLPEGWVTAPEIGLTRNQQLKALGNGVVPQQAELALSILWPWMSQAVAA